MSITNKMTLNDISLLQYFKIPEKTKSVYHPKQMHQQRLSDQKYLSQPCAAKTLKMQLRTNLQQDILLLTIPPLLFSEKRKLEHDVDHKINKLSPEASVSK